MTKEQAISSLVKAGFGGPGGQWFVSIGVGLLFGAVFFVVVPWLRRQAKKKRKYLEALESDAELALLESKESMKLIKPVNIKPTKCVMCKNRNAHILSNVQDRVGSIKESAFCSLTCAARWACMSINNEMHLCPVTNQWESDMDGCELCNRKPDGV